MAWDDMIDKGEGWKTPWEEIEPNYWDAYQFENEGDHEAEWHGAVTYEEGEWHAEARSGLRRFNARGFPAIEDAMNWCEGFMWDGEQRLNGR